MNLKEHLETIREKPFPWAKRHAIPKDAVYRHLSGKPVDYESAKRISEATGGAVSVPEIMEQPTTTTEGTPNADTI